MALVVLKARGVVLLFLTLSVLLAAAVYLNFYEDATTMKSVTGGSDSGSFDGNGVLPLLGAANNSGGEEDGKRRKSVALSHFSDADLEKMITNYGNDRILVALLLTHMKYHGSSLLATTLHGWVKNLFLLQPEMDLVLFFDVEKVRPSTLLPMLQVAKVSAASRRRWMDKKRGGVMKQEGNQTEMNAAEGGHHRTRKTDHHANGYSEPDGIYNRMKKGEEIGLMTAGEWTLLGDGYFKTKFDDEWTLRIHPVRLGYPAHIVANMTLLEDPAWMRCGCPPYCPTRRATVEYVQGTRWYTHDMFLEPLVREYSYWVKLDVDIWFFRPMPFNVLAEMRRKRGNLKQSLDEKTGADRGVSSGSRSAAVVFAHTGYAYNGHGCSNDLHKAIVEYCRTNNITPVSTGQKWWTQDDNVYYSNFVISAVGFHVSEPHMKLAKYLNEYPTGFFRWRWTDQSLFHKVFGVFFGPKEENFLVDWSDLRWQKKIFRPKAIFWHGKSSKDKKTLQKYTNL